MLMEVLWPEAPPGGGRLPVGYPEAGSLTLLAGGLGTDTDHAELIFPEIY